MTEVVYEDQPVSLQAGESVLEGLLRSGYKIPNSCRKGLCHACMMQSDDPIPAQAREGLSDLQKEQGMFLSCCCYPAGKAVVQLAEKTSVLTAKVVQKVMLSDSVMQLFLQSDTRWKPGQHILLWKDDLTARPYSIVSEPGRDEYLELHIRKHAQGDVSAWCHDQVTVGDRLTISRPEGHCVYDMHDIDKPLLLVATDTGLAPLFGVLQEALAHKHPKKIDLYHEAADESGLYLHKQLQQLMTQYSQFVYHPVIQSPDNTSEPCGQLLNEVSRSHSSLRGSKIYLAGATGMIEQLNRRCFMAGAARSDIVAEPFSSQ